MQNERGRDAADHEFELARAITLELGRLGWSAERLLSLFRSPHVRNAHIAYERLGEKEIRRIIGENLAS